VAPVVSPGRPLAVPGRDPDGTQRQPGGVATAVGAELPVLRIDSGGTLEVGSFCLLGREPVAREGDPPATLIKFEDPKLSVSKTHLAYGVDANGLWVTDRNSTNGTTIIDDAGRRITCTPGARQYVQVGWVVQVGQRRLTVEPPDGAGNVS
jgi:hypothetical protein